MSHEGDDNDGDDDDGDDGHDDGDADGHTCVMMVMMTTH